MTKGGRTHLRKSVKDSLANREIMRSSPLQRRAVPATGRRVV